MLQSQQEPKRIRVKFMARPEERIWRRQLPDKEPIWGNCEFIFDPEERDYDWLVVYDDLPPNTNERRSTRAEILSCHKDNTILVTSEPSSIKSYFTDFTDQFGAVLTSQPSWALPHRNRHFQQPALQWFYGVGSKTTKSFSEIEQPLSDRKSELVSIVGSSKQQTHTLHALRYQFISKLREGAPELKVYGREDINMDDKADAVAPFRFHVAIENHYSDHHWTEKLADAFLGEAVPLYVGCPNIEDYFPSESYIKLDIADPQTAIATINALSEAEYEKRLPAVLAAKKKILHEYNLFSVISRIVESSEIRVRPTVSGDTIYSRRLLIKRTIYSGLRHIYQKIRLRLIHRVKDRQLLSKLRP